MKYKVLNSIPSQFDLNNEQQAEHERIINFYEVISSPDGSTPDSTELQELTGIMESDIGAASMYSLNLLIDLGEVDYEEPIEMPDMLKSTEAPGSFSAMNNIDSDTPETIKVMPNPAKDFIIVEYDLEIQQEGLISITDVAGKPFYSVQVTTTKDQLTIDTRNWKRGIYIAELKINGISRESKKFAVVD